MRIFITFLLLILIPGISFNQKETTSKTQLQLVLKEGDAQLTEELYLLEDYLSVIPDPKGELSFDDIRRIEYQDKFRLARKYELSELQNHTRFFWLKLTLKSELDYDLDWLINFGFPEAKIFIPQNDAYKEIVTGSHRTNVSPIIEYSHLPLVPLLIRSKQTKIVYIRVQATIHSYLGNIHFLNYQTSLMSAEHEKKNGIREMILVALSSGFILAILIYHLFLFYYNREYSYLIIAAWCFTMISCSLHYLKLDVCLLNARNGAWLYDKDFLIMLMISGVMIFLLRSLFPIKKDFPRIDLLLQVLLYLELVISVLFGFYYLIDRHGFYELSYSYGNELLGVIPLFIMIIIMLISGVLLFKNSPNAGYFLLGIGTPIFYVIISSTGATFEIKWLPQSISFKWEFGVSVLVLSFALARRYKKLQDEKLIAEKNSTIAEQQKKQKQLEAQRLKEFDHAKTTLYTNITHEFRTPLTVIQGMVKKFKDSESKTLILRNTQSLLDLVNQMLDLSKLESGMMKVNYIQDDIIPFLNYQIEPWSSFANTKNIRLNFYTSVKKLEMDFDTEKLKQIISNLLSNALKFTPDYGKIQVVTEKEEDQLVLIIEDTGIGIAEDKLSHIFDRFYQTDNSSTRGRDGTGIGLALVKELIDLMNGNIEVQSKLSEGTTFKIYLPIHNQAIKKSAVLDVQDSLFHSESVNNLGSSNSTNKELDKLLVIEDNKDIITYLKTLLSDQYEILTAFDGEEGVRVAKDQIPDIILCDVMMPKMDGFEVCRLLKKDNETSHIPIILLTAKVTQADRNEGLSVGADAYLNKPFNENELMIRLNNLIKIRKKLHAKFAKGMILSEPEQDEISPKDRTFLEKLTQFIKSNIEEEDLEVSKLQRVVNISRSTLYKKLKALTGMSPSEFRRTIRLQEARKILSNQVDITVSEVAYKVGYKHLSHFSRDFKETFGMTPSDVKVDKTE